MTKVLITGATGFIGSHCLASLREKSYTLYCLSRNKHMDKENIQWIQADVLDTQDIAKIMQKIAPEYLIHCAWYVEHNKYWESSLNINHLLATLEIWQQFIKNNGKKALFLGSCAETINTGSDSLYGRAKQLTSRIISLINECGSQSKFIWGRIFGLYGPGENLLRIVPYLLICFMQGKVPQIKKPNVKYDFIYVKNLVKMMIQSLFSDIEGVVDFGQANLFSLETLAQTLQKNFFPNAQPALIGSDSDCQEFIPNLEWMKEKLAIELMSFEESIVEYIAYLKTNMSLS